MAEQSYNPESDFLAGINVKLRDIEEKQNIIKDRVILIGENLVSEKEENEKEILQLKSSIKSLNDDVKRIKLALERIIDDSNNFSRKNELEILQRQFQMFQPLELARISDVEKMIADALRKHKE